MASFQPFQPALGSTQQIVIGSLAATSQTIQFNVKGTNPSLLCTFAGATAGTAVYIRMSVESSTVITATNADCPIVAGSAAPSVRLFGSPNPTGVFNIAVVVTATPGTPGTMWFTVGEGGDL